MSHAHLLGTPATATIHCIYLGFGFRRAAELLVIGCGPGGDHVHVSRVVARVLCDDIMFGECVDHVLVRFRAFVRIHLLEDGRRGHRIEGRKESGEAGEDGRERWRDVCGVLNGETGETEGIG